MTEILSSHLGGVSGLTDAFQNSTAGSEAISGPSFSSVLSDALAGYREADHEGDMATLQLLTGRTDDLSNTLIAAKKAEIALSLTVAVRDKAIEAYKEIMNMQV